MSQFYQDERDKIGAAIIEHFSQTDRRKAWFDTFETRLRTRLPSDLQAIKFQVIGSVAEGQAAAESDIDVAIHYTGTDRQAITRIRQAIISLLGEMSRAGETVFDIDIHGIEQSSTLIRMTMLGNHKD